MTKRPLLRLIAVLGILLPATAFAQVQRVHPPLLTDPAVRACVTGIDVSAIEPSVVGVTVISAFAEHEGAQDAANLLAQDVARRVRELLGASEGSVPDAAGKLTWMATWGSVRFSLRPDGTVSMIEARLRGAGDSLAAPGSDLLRRALESVAAEGERWPYVGPPGSEAIEFGLHFDLGGRVEGRMPRWPMRTVSIPVFTMRIPSQLPAAMLPGRGSPRYPNNARAAGVTDDFVFSVRFDAKGKGIRASFVAVEGAPTGTDPDLWVTVTAEGVEIKADGTIRFGTGDDDRTFRGARPAEHDWFVNSVRAAVDEMRFQRGHIGGCELEARIETRITFAFRTYGP